MADLAVGEEGFGGDDGGGGCDVPPPSPREALWRLVSDRPPLYVCRDFLTHDECEAILRLVDTTVSQHTVSQNGQAKLRVDLNSSDPSEDASVLRSVERRIAALSGVKLHEGEMPWAVHFTPDSFLLPASSGPATEQLQQAAAATSSAPHQEPRRSAGRPMGMQRGNSRGPERVGPRRLSDEKKQRPAENVKTTNSPEPPVESNSPSRMSLGLHVDTNNCRQRRWVTFIVYLQSTPAAHGGHTVFPLALPRGAPEPRTAAQKKLRSAAEVLLANNVHHTGQAINPLLGEQVYGAGQLLLQQAEHVAAEASSGGGGPSGGDHAAGIWWSPTGTGLAVSPQRGSCVAFFTRSGSSGGAIDPRSWHAGASVLVRGELPLAPEAHAGAASDGCVGGGRGGGKWTLQKFREAPAEALKACCVETFARQHGALYPSCGGGVRFEVENGEP